MTKSVLTLIASPDKRHLTRQLTGRVSAAINAAGGMVIETDWLADALACDLIFTRIPPEEAQKLAHEALGDEPVDAIAQATASRQKRMLIADMDSTIITVECIDEIADFAGVKAKVSAITERAMRGELDFAAALTERVGLLKGLSESVLEQVYTERVKIMPGARELLATMRTHGAYAVLVSGGFNFFTSRVREAVGFDRDLSNTLEIKAGKLTGKVVLPILDRNSKLQTLMQVSSTKDIRTEDILAVGDGANDVPMLMAAGLGVAYHAKPVVQQSARCRLNHCDLSALLYVQGYRESEIIRP